MRTQTPPVLPRTERRIRRDARSQILRERALALRQAGWTLANIGQALGVSVVRVHQMIRKAERLRLISQSEKGAPSQERPSDSGPLPAGQTQRQAGCIYDPPLT